MTAKPPKCGDRPGVSDGTSLKVRVVGDPPLLVCTQPLVGSHASLVHTLPSSQLGAGPPAQAPARQVSLSVQALPSLQAVPSGAAGLPQTPVAGSQLP